MDDPISHPSQAGEELLAELYDELRQLARARMARLAPGNTLQPTALVHEAYLRLAGAASQTRWQGRPHFFGAAARAMRQILVDQARRKAAHRHGGGQQRLDADEFEIAVEFPVEDLIALDQALTQIAKTAERQAQVAELRLFAGLEREEIAELLNTSLRTVDREWAAVAAKLHRRLKPDSSG